MVCVFCLQHFGYKILPVLKQLSPFPIYHRCFRLTYENQHDKLNKNNLFFMSFSHLKTFSRLSFWWGQRKHSASNLNVLSAKSQVCNEIYILSVLIGRKCVSSANCLFSRGASYPSWRQGGDESGRRTNSPLVFRVFS